jgi:hypothetical protein
VEDTEEGILEEKELDCLDRIKTYPIQWTL